MPIVVINPTIRRICHTYPMIFGKRTAEDEEQWKGEKCLNTMRQSFHRALTTCTAPLPAGKKYVAVRFLTKELIFYVVDAKGKGQEIFDEASKHLGLLDPELFGLAFYQDGDYLFIDSNLKVSKYAARGWKTNCNGVGGDGQPLLVLHMRIKFYVDCHLLISEKVVRHHYYLQLRENVQVYNLPVSEEKAFVLAALALQADLGNYDDEKHKNRYFEISNYFPAWIVSKIGEDFIVRNMPALHKDNSGLSRGEAQVGYIKEASEVTTPHNLHFHRMRRKKGKQWGYVWLGIGDSGIHIYEEMDDIKSLLSTFLWCDIAKLHFEKKKFEILSEGSPEYRRFTYFVDTDNLAKNLLLVCRMTHHFHMSNQNRVEELKKLEIEGGKPYREAYIYTDKFDQAREQKQNSLQKVKGKSKISNSTVNMSSFEKSNVEKNVKDIDLNLSDMRWDGKASENGLTVSQHLSMEALPLVNGCKFSTEMKARSQSIPCLPDCSLTAYSSPVHSTSSSKLSEIPAVATPTSTSTLLSRSSCASTCTDSSTCSSLSLANTHGRLANTDSNGQWVKCDSFEELTLTPPSPDKVHKVCISTFSDKHVRTASVYDAVGLLRRQEHSRPISSSQTNLSSSKKVVVDVKRSPSFNVCPSDRRRLSSCGHGTAALPAGAQRLPSRQYVSNSHTPSSSRTATRIGVSSLSRDQRLPLTLFNDRRVLGSEPNLYIPINSCSDPHSSAIDFNLKTQSSRSELNLNALESAAHGVLKLSLPDVCSNGLEGPDFPCIPPPPAYRNDVQVEPRQRAFTVNVPAVSHMQSRLPTSSILAQLLAERMNSGVQRTSSSSSSSPPDVMDLHQLREKSKDLDLPLISALCNDRSLLKLPKTVPTCSRQRHLGSSDPQRYSRTSSLPNGEGIDPLLVNHGRPISWHVDSTQVPHWSDVAKPCSASWDNNMKTQHDIRKPRSSTVDGSPMTMPEHMPTRTIVPENGPIRTILPIVAGARSMTVPLLPPTILTSFTKTPVKPVRSVNYSDSYRHDTNQLIPTKLLAGSLSCIPNGRLCHKGLSS